ncbi:CLUMA_CG010317, isoform A [Clunio marinus]|uniref:CLUMA_CG010317, isoform A n=1 Tax=Clunio marinus TaxID=568069 RepID=A0A1J1IBL0_9DIPT|nr:CLUMA_CG010317, isoform A [Clunio marinus]
MTTTAKQSSSSTDVRGSSPASSNFEAAEDLETIAKQISDHAEAIYQEWKARGLAPTEILKCHPDTDSTGFNRTLSPKSSPTTPQSSTSSRTILDRHSPSSPLSPEILAKAPDLSNSNLKQLVNSFVNEDKARLAAQRSDSPIGTSIKYTLKKFENLGERSPSPVANPPSYSSNAKSYSSPQQQDIIHKTNSTLTNNNNNNNLNYLNKNEQSQQHHVPDVLKDTIEKSSKRQKPETPVKPEHLLNHVPTWPLKHRQIVQNNKSDMKTPVDKKVTPPTSSSKSPDIDVMDEVSREEEKLINALKTGTVLSNNECLPEVIKSSLNEYKVQAEQQLNGISTVMKENSRNDDALSQPTPPPQKPNHTPIYVPHKEEQSKGFSSFARVATTRIPSRHDSKSDDKKFELKSVPSPVRPFLSRGSVAERVLIFEKCPEKAPIRQPAEKPKIQIKPASKILPPLHSTLQRHLRKSTNFTIPQFYFPNGKPPPAITTETTVQRLELVFNQFENYEIPRDKFHIVVTVCQVPLYWRVPLFMCTQLTKTGCVNGNRFLDFWRQMTSFCHDAASRFIYIISRGNKSRPYMLPEDLAPLIQDVVDSHPGLAFLKEAAEFHSRYVHTVIARIFYSVNRSWSGRITVGELRKSNLMEVIQLLEEEEDINQIMAYFSYEHFYVIYCKFWELDRDHDLFIDQQDLARHNDHALSSRMIERIFSGCVTRGRGRQNSQNAQNSSRMSYTDFVWFLLAEEDKNHPTAIEYWFRCMDIDGDGILSMYELEYFYEEQQHRMEQLGIETLPFEDCLCQMLDMIKPIKRDCITLTDLKRCKMTPIFFDTFFNLEKYMEHEQRDPFAQKEGEELSDWDRYAAQEYELLVAEESNDGTGFDDTDEYEPYDSNVELLESQIDDCSNEW